MNRIHTRHSRTESYLLAGLLLAAAAGPAAAEYGSYKAALDAGRSLTATKKYSDARTAVDEALARAGTVAERADALLVLGKIREEYAVKKVLGGGKSAERVIFEKDIPGARTGYEEILKLPDLPQDRKELALLAIANTYALENKNDVARSEFGRIAAMAGVAPGTRAAAHLGKARAYSLNNPYNRQDNIFLAVAEFKMAAELEAAPADLRADGWIEAADLHYRLKEADKALAALSSALILPGVSDERKAKALLGLGVFHSEKMPSEARAAWSRIPALAGATTVQKMNAHQGLAQSYLKESNFAQAQAEMEKAVALPGLNADQKHNLQTSMGDVLLTAKDYPGARSWYEKAAAVPGLTSFQRQTAQIRFGHTYAEEKNYTAARDAWRNAMGTMPSDKVEPLKLIAASYILEQKYAEARAAYQEWTDLPLGETWKHEAWLLVGESYEREKNIAAAREQYQKVTAGEKVRPIFLLRAQMGLVRGFDAEGNVDGAAQTYARIPGSLSVDPFSISPADAQQLNAVRPAVMKRVWDTAAAWAKDPKTAGAAVTVYTGLSQSTGLPPADRNTALLAMGDLLMEQGKLVEAKAAYQKVLDATAAATGQKETAKQKLAAVAEREQKQP